MKQYFKKFFSWAFQEFVDALDFFRVKVDEIQIKGLRKKLADRDFYSGNEKRYTKVHLRLHLMSRREIRSHHRHHAVAH